MAKLVTNEEMNTYGKTLEEIRSEANISIMLPLPAEAESNLQRFEVVTVNGRNTQIKLGEPVGVSWQVYEALKHGRYANVNILV